MEGKEIVTTVYVNGERRNSPILKQVIGKQERLLIHIATQSGANRIENDHHLQEEFARVGSNSAEYDEGKIRIEKCGSQGKRSFWQRLKIAIEN